MVAYADQSDLLVGNIPLPAYIDATKVMQDAADEIDSQIGFRYKTPVDISDQSTIDRPVKLLLKRLNVHLASGRLIMQVAAASEDNALHAYGASLVKSATDALVAISSGAMDLPSVPVSDDAPADSGPQIANKDAESNVEAFYDRISNPYWVPPGVYGERIRYPWQNPYPSADLGQVNL